MKPCTSPAMLGKNAFLRSLCSVVSAAMWPPVTCATLMASSHIAFGMHGTFLGSNATALGRVYLRTFLSSRERFVNRPA